MTPEQWEPGPQDDNDPAYKEELFETFKYMGWTPDDLREPVRQAEYKQWLVDHADALE